MARSSQHFFFLISRLYSTSGGRWFITDRPKLRPRSLLKEFFRALGEDGIAACTGLVASVAPHQNRFPQARLELVRLHLLQETEQWQEFCNGVWQVATAVAVVVREPVA